MGLPFKVIYSNFINFHISLKTKTAVVCGICGDKSHPTTDCPRKKDYLAGIPIEK